MGGKTLNNIKELRWKLGMTTQDIATRGGLSESTVSRVENGRRNPSQMTMILISKGLGLPVQDIFIFDCVQK